MLAEAYRHDLGGDPEKAVPDYDTRFWSVVDRVSLDLVGVDSAFESEFAAFVSRAAGARVEEAKAGAKDDAGPLIDACNRHLDRALDDMTEAAGQ